MKEFSSLLGDWRASRSCGFLCSSPGTGNARSHLSFHAHFVGIRIIPSIREDKDSVKINVSSLLSARKAYRTQTVVQSDPGRAKTRVLLW